MDTDALARLRHAVTRIRDETRGRTATGLSHHDADEDAGSFTTDGALGFDPFPLFQAFAREGADVVVMGQVAGIMHGSSELTGDLDLLWDGDARRRHAMASAFASVGAALTDAEGLAVACDADAFALAKVCFAAPTVSGDCCTPSLKWGDLDIAGIIDRSDAAVDADGLAVRFVSAADLVTMRRAVGRPKDLRRAEELAQ